ncbi:hypothetical protein SUGI_0455860 [Cryptomeria japonica]|nr:hypothetical protein SUGI_0455860 [Cryptomeria japonica]
MDDDLKGSSSIKDGDHEHQESPSDQTPLSVVPISSPHHNNPFYASKLPILTDASCAKGGRYESADASCAKKGRYESPWRVVTNPTQAMVFPPSLSPSNFSVQQNNLSSSSLSPSHFTLQQNNPSSSPSTQQQQQQLSSPSSSTKSQPSQGGQDNNNNALALRKGKFVSPVWKPHEMLWLARAWRIQYLGDPSKSSQQQESLDGMDTTSHSSKINKYRSVKDREVAEFLNKHGINRDAKTAGTKWDNMLGEFRKVYEWERGPEKEQVGKSYFRLSPYERKLHRLPASFDEEVYEELAQFMGPRQRSSPRNVQPTNKSAARGPITAEKKESSKPKETKADDTRLMQAIVPGNETIAVAEPLRTSEGNTLDRNLQRIGKVKIIWEETTHIWAEEGEYQQGRLKVDQLNFLNANELTFFDETWTGSTVEAFEGGPLKGYSTDLFIPGQQIKVFGRRRAGSSELQPLELPSKAFPPLHGIRDRTDYFVGCLRVPASSLPTLFELSSYLQEPPSKHLRFPVRPDVYEDLPTGKEVFFCASSDTDCRAITYEIVGPLIRQTSSRRFGRESFIGLWDDCINKIIYKLCAIDVVMLRKSGSYDSVSQEWPSMCGFVKSSCLWRGEETDSLKEGDDPAAKIVDKTLWSYGDSPYILGYYAIGNSVTFCALSKSHERVVRIDLVSVNLSSPAERLKILVPCWRIARLLPTLSDYCYRHNSSNIHSDYERLDRGNGKVIEVMPGCVKKIFSNRRKWANVKEIYDFLDNKIPHVEYIQISAEKELALIFKPRGYPIRPRTLEQLIEALKYVTKALVALHNISFMHRDLRWDNVMKKIDSDEWFIIDFEDAIGAPQIYPHNLSGLNHAPEMSRGLHGVKVDVWGVGHLIKTCGLNVSELFRDLQNRCLEQDPDQRPTAAECYHHLLQLQSSLCNY